MLTSFPPGELRTVSYWASAPFRVPSILYAPVMAITDCQLDRIYSDLGKKHLGMSGRDFLGWVIELRPTLNVGLGLRLDKKENGR